MGEDIMTEGKGQGWHGESRRHSDAARGIRTILKQKEREVSGLKLLELVIGKPKYLPHLTNQGLQDLQVAAVLINDAEMIENLRNEMFDRNMRDPEQDRHDDLMDEAIEAMYDAGLDDVAHDVERGNLGKAWNEVSRFLAIAEKKQPLDVGDINRLLAAKEALKAIP